MSEPGLQDVAAPGHEHVSTETFAQTMARLRGAQKPAGHGSPAYSRFVNRRIGRVLAAASYRLRLTPNGVTAISAAWSLAGVLLLALGPATTITGIAVGLLLLVGYAFDSADGQLARLRGGGSAAGEWLDHVVDSIKVVVLHVAVLIAWYRSEGATSWQLAVPLAFAVVSSVYFFVQILTDQLRRAHPTQAPAPAGTDLRAVLRSLIVWPTDYGVLCLAFVLLGWHDGFAVLYTLLLLGTMAYLAAALPKWFVEMSRFTPGGRLP